MKDFLLIANKNCVTYKEFFPFIKDRIVNIGYTHPGDYDGVMGVPITVLDHNLDNVEIDGCLYGDHTIIDGETTTITPLEGNGDFQSGECTQIMKDSDIVITNPPFSLFRQFIKWLNYDAE